MGHPRQFGRDNRASIAVEFAILAPLMLAIMFGSYEVTRVVRASLKLSNAAQALGDLVAQQDSVASSDIADYCTGMRMTLAPITGTVTARIASVTYQASGTAPTLDWQDNTDCGDGSGIANPATLGAPYTPNPADSVIIVQTTYAFSLPVSYLLPKTITMTRTTFSRPRDGTKVAHTS